MISLWNTSWITGNQVNQVEGREKCVCSKHSLAHQPPARALLEAAARPRVGRPRLASVLASPAWLPAAP